MIDAFIERRGITVLPPGMATGAQPFYKATAYGSSEDASWLLGKTTAKCNEENLAKAKILTMIQLLAGRTMETGVTPGQKEQFRRDAHRFFFSKKERADLEAWCDTAGFNPDYVRERAREVFENGLPEWRAKPGRGERYNERRQYRERIKQRQKELA